MKIDVKEENQRVLDWIFMDDGFFYLDYISNGPEMDYRDFKRVFPKFLNLEWERTYWKDCRDE